MRCSFFLAALVPTVSVVLAYPHDALEDRQSMPCVPKFTIPGAENLDPTYALIPLGPGEHYCDGSGSSTSTASGSGSRSGVGSSVGSSVGSGASAGNGTEAAGASGTEAAGSSGTEAAGASSTEAAGGGGSSDDSGDDTGCNDGTSASVSPPSASLPSFSASVLRTCSLHKYKGWLLLAFTDADNHDVAVNRPFGSGSHWCLIIVGSAEPRRREYWRSCIKSIKYASLSCTSLRIAIPNIQDLRLNILLISVPSLLSYADHTQGQHVEH